MQIIDDMGNSVTESIYTFFEAWRPIPCETDAKGGEWYALNPNLRHLGGDLVKHMDMAYEILLQDIVSMLIRKGEGSEAMLKHFVLMIVKAFEWYAKATEDPPARAFKL